MDEMETPVVSRGLTVWILACAAATVVGMFVLGVVLAMVLF